jgi:hypothetical protein
MLFRCNSIVQVRGQHRETASIRSNCKLNTDLATSIDAQCLRCARDDSNRSMQPDSAEATLMETAVSQTGRS